MVALGFGHPTQRRFEVTAQTVGVLHERLHLRLAERGPHAPAEAAPEPLDPGDAEPTRVEVDERCFPLEDPHPGVGQGVGDLGLSIGVVVVVPQHGDHGDQDVAERPGHVGRLLGRAAAGEVAGEQQHVGTPMHVGERFV